MTSYDSSLLIDYLDGQSVAVQYVEDTVEKRAVASPLVLFEVLQGEVFRSSPSDFESVLDALAWLDVGVNERTAPSAAELQDRMAERGAPMAPRDAFIAGTALLENERLATRDSDFDSDALRQDLTVDVVRQEA